MACAQIEHANQCAAHESSRGGWLCNWTEGVAIAKSNFDEAEAALRALPNWEA